MTATNRTLSSTTGADGAARAAGADGAASADLIAAAGAAGADLISAVAARSDAELRGRLDELFRLKAAVDGEIVVHLGEVERREAFELEGATSGES
ncbi:MAG TPA: hypothetical protein VHX67_05260, partial [Acidimicrobiales bacterium]|nr:hypothetical protein [Acidimicrobiales bacterium]